MAQLGSKRRRIHVSKNKKKSWNKFSDIKDIEDFLEEKRFEERVGFSSDKKDDQIFFLDKKAEGSLPSDTGVKKCKKDRPLRCFKSLTAYSQVAIPVPKNCGVVGKKQKERLGRALEKKLKNIELPKQSSQPRGREALALREFYSLWAEDKKGDEEIIKKEKPKVPCHRYQKPSLLPSVEVPHPGASYNPTYGDHQELLLEAVLVEQKKEKEEQHIKRVLTDMFPTVDKAPTEETWLQEMSQGLFEEKGDEDVENQDGLFEIGNPPVRAEDRKTKAQKRKKKMIKAEDHQRKLCKQEKRKMREIYRLRSIKSIIKEQEKKSAEKQDLKDKREMEQMFKPHTLSSYKYQPQDLEVTLTEDMPHSMRTLKAEGNVLEDRFKSLQRRNIIEPRIKQRMKRKYKLKKQIKRSHRDFK